MWLNIMKNIIVLISVFITFYNYSEIVGQFSDGIKYLDSDYTIAVYQDSIDSGMLWYDNKELGLKFKFDRWEETFLKYPADTTDWVFFESKSLGVRFKHPQGLKINLIKKGSNHHNLDSVSTIKLGYSVKIYSSKRSFEEIAYSETFGKKSGERSSQNFTEVKTQNEQWVIFGLSKDPAYFLDCKEWCGLRGETTRGGGSMGLLPWRASFLRSKSEDENHIIISFYDDPFSRKPENQLISENAFYMIVSSLEIIK